MAPLYRSTGYGVPSGTAPLSPGLPGCRTLRMPMTLTWTVALPKDKHRHSSLKPFEFRRDFALMESIEGSPVINNTIVDNTDGM